MHTRIHRIFAERFLAALKSLPESDPLKLDVGDMTKPWIPRVSTALEIVLHEDGSIASMGVTRTSGNAVFDIGALSSVKRASPFPHVPPEILSTDGRLYLAWEFHRNLAVACSTISVLPALLDIAPRDAPAVAP